MADRTLPFGAFNFAVDIGGDLTAGFSDVSGLTTEMTVAEYRAGNDKARYTHKVPGLHKTGDVTLKRGIINSSDLQAWITQVREQGPAAKRDVVITMFDGSSTTRCRSSTPAPPWPARAAATWRWRSWC